MPGPGKIRAACTLLACALFLSACGGSDDDGTIPASNAQELETQLDQVQTAVGSGDCTTARANAEEFVNGVNALPATAGTDTKAKLRTAGENLQRLISSQCASGPTGPQGPKTTSSSTTAPPPTTTETTTSTTSTTSTTTTEEPPPENGGNGGPGGDGGGGGTDIGGGGTGPGKGGG